MVPRGLFVQSEEEREAFSKKNSDQEPNLGVLKCPLKICVTHETLEDHEVWIQPF